MKGFACNIPTAERNAAIKESYGRLLHIMPKADAIKMLSGICKIGTGTVHGIINRPNSHIARYPLMSIHR